ncbi:MAG: chemotaxis protein CheW [Planctomycetota bacterium]
MTDLQTIENEIDADPESIKLVTFTVGEIVLGLDIAQVQEIGRHLDVTKVPGASPMIHGVVNLRGDVVTVLDPHRIFGIEPSQSPENCRNLILNLGGERIGVLVDQVSDILSVKSSELSRRPSNISSIDRQFIDSVYLRDEEIVVVLNATQLIDAIEQPSDQAKVA